MKRPWFVRISPCVVVVALGLCYNAILNPTLDNKTAILTVTPTTVSGSGPSVWLGLFNSCSRASKNDRIVCIDSRWNTRYDLSVLPQNAPSFVLDTPPDLPRAFVCFFALGVLPVLLLLDSLVCWWPKGPRKFKEMFENIFLKSQFILWLTLISGLVGGLNFWVLQMYSDKTCMHFNEFVALQGPGGPKLVASVGNAFGFAYTGYAFLGAFFIIVLAQTNFAVGGGILTKAAPIENPPLVFVLPFKPRALFNSVKSFMPGKPSFRREETATQFYMHSNVGLGASTSSPNPSSPNVSLGASTSFPNPLSLLRASTSSPNTLVTRKRLGLLPIWKKKKEQTHSASRRLQESNGAQEDDQQLAPGISPDSGHEKHLPGDPDRPNLSPLVDSTRKLEPSPSLPIDISPNISRQQDDQTSAQGVSPDSRSEKSLVRCSREGKSAQGDPGSELPTIPIDRPKLDPLTITVTTPFKTPNSSVNRQSDASLNAQIEKKIEESDHCVPADSEGCLIEPRLHSDTYSDHGDIFTDPRLQLQNQVLGPFASERSSLSYDAGNGSQTSLNEKWNVTAEPETWAGL